ncbi:hypothetical protein K431DRAFT_135349 [Polychaeton citri CBS 116435]|uniref:Uncharacterized protein n=1 Tax=Polychaeton citri CBS 116435 TaxID=1314669 RepID=A0A9P4Q5M9_9PEZI|nr:hypothetical protein K431DRAFT_135349 [Polychaeton citri CBS 116435]
MSRRSSSLLENPGLGLGWDFAVRHRERSPQPTQDEIERNERRLSFFNKAEDRQHSPDYKQKAAAGSTYSTNTVDSATPLTRAGSPSAMGTTEPNRTTGNDEHDNRFLKVQH